MELNERMENVKRRTDFSFSCNRMRELLEIRTAFRPVMRCVSQGTALHDDYHALNEQLKRTITAEAKNLVAASEGEEV